MTEAFNTHDYFVEHTKLRDELLAQLLALDFQAFEQCIKHLLIAMGYQEVELLSRIHRRGQRTTHGGRDAHLHMRVGVTHVPIIMQIKQYTVPVPRRFVDELRSTMLRVGARQALLVTTSTFSNPAREASRKQAESGVGPVRLIDGEELLDLLISCHIGTWEEPGNGDRHFGLDYAYFEDLQQKFPVPQRKPKNRRSAPVLAQLLAPATYKAHPMLWRTHVLLGVNALWLIQPFPVLLNRFTLTPVLVAAVFGALLPDLDAVRSKLQSVTVFGIKPLAPLSGILHQTLGHRGALHSGLALVGLGIVCAGMVPWLGLAPAVALWLGYASHLIADACTRQGIPLWFPLKKRVNLLPKGLRFRTGSLGEEALLPILAVCSLALLFHFLPIS